MMPKQPKNFFGITVEIAIIALHAMSSSAEPTLRSFDRSDRSTGIFLSCLEKMVIVQRRKLWFEGKYSTLGL
jgi:hypothetical protein